MGFVELAGEAHGLDQAEQLEHVADVLARGLEGHVAHHQLGGRRLALALAALAAVLLALQLAQEDLQLVPVQI